MEAPLRGERFTGEGPPEWFGHGLVEVGDEGLEALLELGSGFETAPAQEFTRQDAEPDFDLVEPGSVFWGEVEADLVRAVAQECFPRGLVLEMAGFAFLAQLFIDAAQPGNKTDRPLGQMSVEVVANDLPPCRGLIGSEQRFEVSHEALF